MATNTIPSPCPKSNLTRRTALVSTAACGALALPAGVAIAANAAAIQAPADPGLAKLEAGYDRWHEMLVQLDALQEREGEARRRAWARVPEVEDPEPVPDPDVAKLWKGPSGLIDEARDPDSYVMIPQELLARYDAFRAEWGRWWDRKAKLDANDPDYHLAQRLERQKDALYHKAERLRRKLLKIPTTSPRGLLIKLAIATDTDRLDEIDKRFARPRYYGTFDACEDLMAPLLADLRAMTEARS